MPNLHELEAALLEYAYSQREVARKMSVHHTTIGRRQKRFHEVGSHSRRPSIHT